MTSSKSVKLVEPFDSGMPGPEHFRVDVEELSAPTEEGSVQLQLTAVSADPFLRGRMKTKAKGGVMSAGETMTGFVVGKVVVSNGNSKWKVGDLFGASLPFTSVQNLTSTQLSRTLIWKLTDYVSESELDLGLGILGMPGSTAYGGVVDILRPKEGQTIWISAASGAVGSMAGPLAKHLFNCTTIGSCGGPEKCELIKSKFGYDHAVDYKKASNKDELKALLKEAAPDGIDMYYENVGGIHFEAAFESLRPGGRIAVCGGISQYNDEDFTPIAFDPTRMIYPCLRIEGFMCMPWLSGQQGNFLETMHKLLREGKLKQEETIFEGLDSFGEAFQALFTGKNTGKVVVHVQ